MYYKTMIYIIFNESKSHFKKFINKKELYDR